MKCQDEIPHHPIYPKTLHRHPITPAGRTCNGQAGGKGENENIKIEKMKLKIKVTKDILRQSMYCGLNGDVVTTSCAIALAVRDIFPNADVVYDYLMPFGVGGGDNIYHKQRKFIEEFDRLNPHHRTLMPELEFEIELSDKHISRINISDIHKSATLEVVV